jgi:formate hydrogenlyase subunit 3/multisubunit Na+/H+ antiporter MnhD subunit
VEHQRCTRPWINEFFWMPAIGGLFVVVGVAVVYYFEGSCRFDQVPYNNVAFALFFLAILVELLEKAWYARKRRPPAS